MFPGASTMNQLDRVVEVTGLHPCALANTHACTPFGRLHFHLSTRLDRLVWTQDTSGRQIGLQKLHLQYLYAAS